MSLLINNVKFILDKFNRIKNFNSISEIELKGIIFDETIPFVNNDGVLQLMGNLYPILNSNCEYDCIFTDNKNGEMFLTVLYTEMELNEL